MHDIFFLGLDILFIAFLNIILSFDNISVIAIITNNFPSKYMKKAYILGISLAVICTIFFTSIISIIMEIKWLPIQLLGGLLLIKITLDMIRNDNKDKNSNQKIPKQDKEIKLYKAIIKITLASLSLSFDNILAIAGAADGNIRVISCGLLVSLPIILLTCRLILRLMQKKRILLYISGAILIYTAFEMMFSYQVIAPYIPDFIASTIPIFFSVIVIFYGIYIIKKTPSKITMVCKTKDSK